MAYFTGILLELCFVQNKDQHGNNLVTFLTFVSSACFGFVFNVPIL